MISLGRWVTLWLSLSFTPTLWNSLDFWLPSSLWTLWGEKGEDSLFSSLPRLEEVRSEDSPSQWVLKWLPGKSPSLAETEGLVREARDSPTSGQQARTSSQCCTARNYKVVIKCRWWILFCKIGSLEVYMFILMKVPCVWNPFEMSFGAFTMICNHASFLAQTSNKIHYPFYSIHWTPHNFLFKNQIHCQRIKILYWGFSWSGVNSEQFKRGTPEVFGQGSAAKVVVMLKGDYLDAVCIHTDM